MTATAQHETVQTGSGRVEQANRTGRDQRRRNTIACNRGTGVPVIAEEKYL
ncbi:MAG TPA: hypothetical protein VG317_17095 [Pseudonocardiaceae bacterium]|nr:hypothetical protein [Pseudonocardiaceae bacterium]